MQISYITTVDEKPVIVSAGIIGYWQHIDTFSGQIIQNTRRFNRSRVQWDENNPQVDRALALAQSTLERYSRPGLDIRIESSLCLFTGRNFILLLFGAKW